MITINTPGELAALTRDVNMELLGHARKEEIELMMGTGATESGYRKRVQEGDLLMELKRARGLFQIEPPTAWDVYNSFLRYQRHRHLYHRMMGIVFGLESAPFFIPKIEEITDLLEKYDDYSVCMARFCYYRQPPAIPTDLRSQAEYYKEFFNTRAGAGSVEKYIRDWDDYGCAMLVRAVMEA